MGKFFIFSWLIGISLLAKEPIIFPLYFDEMPSLEMKPIDPIPILEEKSPYDTKFCRYKEKKYPLGSITSRELNVTARCIASPKGAVWQVQNHNMTGTIFDVLAKTQGWGGEE